MTTRGVFMKKSKTTKHAFVSCIVAAGGSGTRMGSADNKLFLELLGVPVLAHTLMALDRSADIDEIVVAARETDMIRIKYLIESYGITKATAVVRGGAHRGASVKAALSAVAEQADLIVVHDGARPLVDETVISAVIEDAKTYGAAATGVRPKCTLKRADKDGFIKETVDRSEIFEIQTPQVFAKKMLLQAYDTDADILSSATDDCSLVEKLGEQIKITEGSYRNIKVTTPEDIPVAESLLEARV